MIGHGAALYAIMINCATTIESTHRFGGKRSSVESTGRRDEKKRYWNQQAVRGAKTMQSSAQIAAQDSSMHGMQYGMMYWLVCTMSLNLIISCGNFWGNYVTPVRVSDHGERDTWRKTRNAPVTAIILWLQRWRRVMHRWSRITPTLLHSPGG